MYYSHSNNSIHDSKTTSESLMARYIQWIPVCLLILSFRELSWSPNYSPVSFRACFEVDILS